ncbi:MAG: adenosine-specific kinase [Candidatus Omnitrophota bacterium]
MDIRNVKIEKPDDVNVIIGQSHFIKTVEDLYEAIISSAPQMLFGIAFCEASGACKIRLEGNDENLKKLAAKNAQAIGAGHSFVIMLQKGFPINILNQIKNTCEVCTIFAATANPLEVIIAESETGRGILGVIDGQKPKGIEDQNDIAWRKDLLRRFGYKR